jgi:hypothetical protein
MLNITVMMKVLVNGLAMDNGAMLFPLAQVNGF